MYPLYSMYYSQYFATEISNFFDILSRTPHTSPTRTRCGMSFVSLKSVLDATFVIAIDIACGLKMWPIFYIWNCWKSHGSKSTAMRWLKECKSWLIQIKAIDMNWSWVSYNPLQSTCFYIVLSIQKHPYNEHLLLLNTHETNVIKVQ